MKRKGFLPNRRLVLAGLMSGAADRVLANGPTRSLYPEPRPGGLAESVSRERRAPAVESLVTEANLGGEVTFAVIDAQTGEVLETRKPFLPMPPASVAKALTATYGLSALGPEHRFRTCLMTDAPIEDGILQGDLVLVGTGDPTLDTDGLAVLAAQLKPIGIFEVKGKLLTYGASLPQLRLIDASQPDHVGYNPSVSGLNLNFNRVHFEWKRAGNGYALAMDARTQKYRPAVSIARISVADRRAPVYSYQDLDGVDDWTVARTALGNGGSRWLPTRVPDAYCSDVFRTLARSHGISMADGGARSSFPAGHRVLAEWQSAQLRDIVGGMLRYSTNLTAEVVGLSATRALGGEVSNLRESGAHMASWFQEHVRMPRASFLDHSGLGDLSRVSAFAMAGALRQLGPSVDLASLMKTAPMLDRAGNAIRNSPAQVRAKTGTLNFVSALGGYITAPDGRELVFAIFCADTARRAGLSKAQRERPDGGRSWTRRARKLHGQLLARWAAIYSV